MNNNNIKLEKQASNKATKKKNWLERLPNSNSLLAKMGNILVNHIYDYFDKQKNNSPTSTPEKLNISENNNSLEDLNLNKLDTVTTKSTTLQLTSKKEILSLVQNNVINNDSIEALQKVRGENLSLKFVDSNIQTLEMCYCAVQKNRGELKHIKNKELRNQTLQILKNPVKIYNDNTALQAIKQDSLNLQYVNEKLQTPQICVIAIEKDMTALKMIKDPEIRKETLQLLKQKQSQSIEFNYYQSYDNCFDAVKRDGLNLKIVPEKFQNKELCIEAINNNPVAMKFITNKNVKQQVQKIADNTNSKKTIQTKYSTQTKKQLENIQINKPTFQQKNKNSIKL